MNSIKKIKQLVNALIKKEQESLPELKKELESFFKGITQERINKEKKEDIKVLSDALGLIHEEISPVTLAKLDALFNKKPENNLHICKESKFSQTKFVNLAKEIYRQQHHFEEKDIDNFLRWLAWVLVESPWDDCKLSYKNKELEINILLESYDKPTIKLEIFSTKLYAEEAKNIANSIK